MAQGTAGAAGARPRRAHGALRQRRAGVPRRPHPRGAAPALQDAPPGSCRPSGQVARGERRHRRQGRRRRWTARWGRTRGGGSKGGTGCTGTNTDVIAPPTDAEGGLFPETNDNSVGILLTHGAARVLLAGDAEAKSEEYMANGPYTGPLTVLKVTHHGSNTSTTTPFLSRFRPKVAVIQVGADNSYGHPTPETLDRLRRAGTKVFRNDEDGDVIVTIK